MIRAQKFKHKIKFVPFIVFSIEIHLTDKIVVNAHLMHLLDRRLRILELRIKSLIVAIHLKKSFSSF